MKIKWLAAFLCAFILGAGFYAPKHASAAPSLHIDAEIGINQRVKQMMPTVLNLTVTNNGDPFSGDLVVDTEVSYNLGSALVYPMDLGAGETKIFTIYLDGFSDRYMYGNSNVPDMFHFYEGGIEKGKKLKYEGNHYVTPRILSPYTEMLMVVTTRKDDVSGVDRIRSFINEDLEVFYTDKKDSPYLAEDHRALKMLDTILFDDLAVQDLTQKQQEALYEWVMQGGHVLFTSNEFSVNGAGIFKEQLPLAFTGQQVTIANPDLQKYVTAGAFDKDAVVQEATAVNGAAITAETGGTVLAATKSVGRGNVTQLAFTLQDPVLTSLTGYGVLLRDALQIVQTPQYGNYYNAYNDTNGWVYVNELFETFKLNTWLLIAGILVYMILVGPVLYIVLKRKDKREKMWLYVPVIAVLTSLVFFLFGAKDRIMKPHIQQMALFEIGEDGSLLGSYTNALLSNKSGDFEYSIADGTTALSTNTANISQVDLHLSSYLKETADGKMVKIRNMNYWSVQSIVGETTIADGGKLLSDLTLADYKLTGTITNDLPVDLYDVALLTGNEEIQIGSLKAGQTIDVNAEVKKQFLAKPYTYYNYNSQNTPDLAQQRKELLKQTAISMNNAHQGPLLVALSDVSLVPIELKKGSKQSAMSYFVMKVQPEVIVNGDVSVTNKDAVPSLEPKDSSGWGHIEDMEQNKAYMSVGQYGLTYDFASKADLKTVNWQELIISYEDSLYDLELLNAKTGEHTVLADGKATITENVQDYVNEEVMLTFILTRKGVDDGSSIDLPKFTLKGVPAK